MKAIQFLIKARYDDDDDIKKKYYNLQIAWKILFSHKHGGTLWKEYCDINVILLHRLDLYTIRINEAYVSIQNTNVSFNSGIALVEFINYYS